MAGFGNKILHKSENHLQLSQNLWHFDETKSSWKLMISFCYFQKRNELYFGCDPCWPSFCPNRVVEEQFLTTLPIFFQDYNMVTQVININSMSQHISKRRNQQKNPRLVELKGKIWPNSTTHKVPLTGPDSPLENRMMNIKNFHGVVQSNNVFFFRLQACEILTRVFYNLFL